MRAKRLLLLVGILIVLIVAVVVVKRRPPPTRLAEEVGFKRLLPESFAADAIHGIDLYQGDKTEQAVRLRRRDDAWVVASHYDAPVKTDKIIQLLDGVRTLEGELRADQADFHGDFRLEDGQALHVLLYTADEMEKPSAHVLAGKSGGRTSFMRVADAAQVYSVNLNLRNEAGLYGDETDKIPEAKPWLNLQLHDIPKDRITAVDLQMPARRFRLTKPQPEAPETAEVSAAEPTGEPKTTPKPVPQWTLEEPQVAYAVKQGAVDGLVSTLRTLRGDDVVAPDKVVEYGLDTPPYRAVLTVQEEKEARDVTVAVGKEVPEQDGKRYVRLGQDGPIYVLPKWSFNQIFPTLGTVLTLDILRVPPDDVIQLTWQQEGQEWTLERQAAAAATAGEEKAGEEKAGEEKAGEEKAGEEKAEGEPEKATPTWRLVQAAETAVDTAAVTSLLNMTQDLMADDWFAQIEEPTGLEAPSLSLVLTQENGTRHHVTFGNTHGKDEDRYTSRAGSAGTFVVSKSTYTSLTEALAKLRPAPPAASDASSSTAPGSSAAAAAPKQP